MLGDRETILLGNSAPTACEALALNANQMRDAPNFFMSEFVLHAA
jgi:hypothetical protein